MKSGKVMSNRMPSTRSFTTHEALIHGHTNMYFLNPTRKKSSAWYISLINEFGIIWNLAILLTNRKCYLYWVFVLYLYLYLYVYVFLYMICIWIFGYYKDTTLTCPTWPVQSLCLPWINESLIIDRSTATVLAKRKLQT